MLNIAMPPPTITSCKAMNATTNRLYAVPFLFRISRKADMQRNIPIPKTALQNAIRKIPIIQAFLSDHMINAAAMRRVPNTPPKKAARYFFMFKPLNSIMSMPIMNPNKKCGSR